MHTIGLDTRCHIDLGFVHVKRRGEIYEKVRVGTITNQADKPKIWEVMESCNIYGHLVKKATFKFLKDAPVIKLSAKM